MTWRLAYRPWKSSWPPRRISRCAWRPSLQNVRRRAEQDVEKAHKFALEKFANDLLPVVDSLERGLELSSPDDEAIKAVREGMQLTLKLFLDTLARHQLEAIDPHGAPFNPDHHQAMAMEESIACRAELGAQGVPEGLSAQWSPAAPGHGRGRQGADYAAAVHRRAGLKFPGATPFSSQAF